MLDTVTLLDAVLRPDDLSSHARDLLLNRDSERYSSVASSWEVAIKYAAGKLTLPDHPERFIPQHRCKLAADVLPIDRESVLHMTRLPFLDRDPLDRILISQALVHAMVLVTPDARIAE